MRKRTRNNNIGQKQQSPPVQPEFADSLPIDLHDKTTVSQIMSEMGRRGGLKGAATLNAKLTPQQRRKSAQRAAQARRANRSDKTGLAS
jgi:hypothetical protein